MRVSLLGVVGFGTVACDCHSLAVCIPQKLSSGSSSWPRSWVSFTALVTGCSRHMKNSFSQSGKT